MKSIILVLFCVSAGHGLFFRTNTDPKWEELAATWGPDPLSSEYFVKQPKTVTEAVEEKYTKLPGLCNGKTLGNRYMKNNDTALIVLYDVQGTIAGVQMAVPISLVNSKFYSFDKQPMFNRDNINGIPVYLLTAYFVDPNTICTTGRTLARLDSEGVGTGLWFQNGSTPLSSVAVPLSEKDTVNTKWIKGACFPSMGIHYWYDNRLDVDCDTFFPAFLLYNKEKLTGFGWIIFNKIVYSKRTELPPLGAITSFLKPVPTCVEKRYTDVGGFTTMHLYFNTSPLNLMC